MKKITRNITTDCYISEDGMEFISESRCAEHEIYIKDSKISKNLKTMNLELPSFGYRNDYSSSMWYMIRNEDEREFMFRKYCGYDSYLNDIYIRNEKKDKNIIRLGDWVCVTKNEEGDITGLFTLDYVLLCMKEFINKAEKVTVNGRY